MTSRLLSLFRILRPSGGVAASSSPNSYAVIQLWRRFFELQEQQAEKNADILEEVLIGPEASPCHGYAASDRVDGIISHIRPVCSEEASRHRKESITEFYREQNVQNTTSQKAGRQVNGFSHARAVDRPIAVSPTPQSLQENQQLNRPNLDIPVQENESNGLAYLSLAQ